MDLFVAVIFGLFVWLMIVGVVYTPGKFLLYYPCSMCGLDAQKLYTDAQSNRCRECGAAFDSGQSSGRWMFKCGFIFKKAGPK